MKPDEKEFLKRCQQSKREIRVRDIINSVDFTMNYKRAWYILEKWSGKGWYDYGVSLDLGWMTEEGMAINRENQGRFD